jgi:hypothetical protein
MYESISFSFFFKIHFKGAVEFFRLPNIENKLSFPCSWAAVIAKKHVYHNVNKVENQCKCLCNLNLIDIVIYVFLRYNGSGDRERKTCYQNFLSTVALLGQLFSKNTILKQNLKTFAASYLSPIPSYSHKI